MADIDVTTLVEEIESALDEVGQLEKWVERRMDGKVDGATLCQAVGEMTQQLLSADPPQSAHWEHLLVAIATHSAKSHSQVGYDVCQAAIAEFSEMIPRDTFRLVTPEQIVTLASALTLALTAQRKLRQRIEHATVLLCVRYPDLMPEIAQRCQDIRQRHGQVSGSEGLFLWDTRRGEWRLSQDFKTYRSA